MNQLKSVVKTILRTANVLNPNLAEGIYAGKF